MKSLGIGLVLALAIACGSKGASSTTAGNQPPPNASDRDSCTTDEDCTLVDACCGCNASGRRVAIRKDAVAEYDATRAQRCGDSMCAQAISTHSSCSAEATCEAGHCKVMAHMGSEDDAPAAQ